MAVLDNTDFREIKKIAIADPVASVVFKEWGLTKAQWKDLFQTAEDWFVDGFLVTPSAAFKAALETSSAGSMTNGQAKQTGFVWMGWRYKVNP